MGCTKHEFTPGETLPAAKVNEIQDCVIALEDGTNPAGDSAKLGGKEPSEYALDTDLANYFPLSGGTVTSPTVSAPIMLDCTHPSISACFTNYKNKGVNLGYLGFNGANTPVVAGANGNTLGELLHTGNKPSGTYTGNGSATSRTINVGGVSKVLMIQNSVNGNALVDEYGALLLPLVGDIQRLSRGECNFKNGVLAMATENVFVNRNGSQFDYYSL